MSFREKGRDFYEEYEQYVPGPVVQSQQDLVNIWQQGFEWKEKVADFRRKEFEFLDKNATKRLLELIFCI